MPLLLLLPLVLIGFLLLWAVLVPVGLWQRYRLGKSRRRALPWLTRLNAWLLLVSVAIYFVSVWIAGFWVDSAAAYGAAGLVIGMMLGWLGLATTQWQLEPNGLFYTPNRWIVLGLTVVVAARILYGVARAWQAWDAAAGESWLAQQGSVLAVGGLVLGYYLLYTWGVSRRLSQS